MELKEQPVILRADQLERDRSADSASFLQQVVIVDLENIAKISQI